MPTNKKDLETPYTERHGERQNIPASSQEPLDHVGIPTAQNSAEIKTVRRFTLLKKLAPTVGLTAFLATITPYIYLWSHNTHMYKIEHIILGFATITLIALLLGMLVHFFAVLFIYNKKMPSWVKMFATVSICICIFLWILLLLHDTFYPLIKLYSYFNIIFETILVAILAGFIIYRTSFKPLNTFLGIILAFSLVSLTYNAILNNLEANKKIYIEDITINLVNKPNIYLFVLESYIDLKMMQDIYKIDTHPLEQYAKQHGFVIYDDIYSNGEATLMALYRLNMMGMTKEKSLGNLDVAMNVRYVLGGHEDNRLYKYLKGQGYTTSAFYPIPSYYMIERGTMLDKTNIPDAYIQQDLMQTIEMFIFSNGLFTEYYLSRNKSTHTFEEYVSETVLSHKKQNTALFFTFKAGAEHTTNHYSYKDQDSWLKEYPKLIEKSNKQIFETINYIIENDNNALIIMLGDHGAWRLRGSWDINKHFGSKKALETTLRDINISPQDLTDDIFKVFLAVRMPKGFDQDISYGYHLSPVNLFRHIFAALNKDDAFLKERVESRSEINDITVYKDGEHQLSK